MDQLPKRKARTRRLAGRNVTEDINAIAAKLKRREVKWDRVKIKLSRKRDK